VTNILKEDEKVYLQVEKEKGFEELINDAI